jgi:hypothetical protein
MVIGCEDLEILKLEFMSSRAQSFMRGDLKIGAIGDDAWNLRSYLTDESEA